MREIIKHIVFLILTIEAKLVLLRYRPKIIAITGTVGKTGTKDAIYQALSTSFHVRKNNKSLNSEIGVPLTILGLDSGWDSPLVWIKNILFGFVQIFYIPNYPKWLVLEVGIDHPGDMKKTASWLKPNVAVVTAFGNVPVHVEFFDSPEQVSEEEGSLINYLKKDGIIILNADDEKVLKLKNKAERKVYTFGQNSEADIVTSNVAINYEEGVPVGMSFKVFYEGNTLPINIRGIVGNQVGYPILAAITTGVALNLSVVPLATALNDLKVAPGRMNLIPGKSDTTIIDDSYNSSPLAVSKALEALKNIETKGNKVAILGDMLELGRFSNSEHKKVGEMVRDAGIDSLVTVGLRSEITAKSAIESGMPESNVFHFEKAQNAVKIMEKFLKPGNIILVKGSQGIRTEKIVKACMKDEEKAEELLVRQEGVWGRR